MSDNKSEATRECRDCTDGRIYGYALYANSPLRAYTCGYCNGTGRIHNAAPAWVAAEVNR